MCQHPHIARIDCNDCKNFSYNLTTGLPILHAGNKISRKEPPCVKDDTICKKVRPGHSDLTDENRSIYEDYHYHRSVSDEPSCVVDRYWFGIIRSVEDDIEESKRNDLLAMKIASRRA